MGEWGPEESGEVGVFVAPDRKAFELEVEWSPSTIEVVSLTDLVDPELRFAWGHGAFAATSLLEEETPTGIRPLDVLVEYLAHLNEQFRGLLTRPMPWAREDYWSVLVTHLRDHSIDPSTAVVLHWGMSSEEVDGGLLDTQGRCFHFTGSLVTSLGPIGEVTTWDELNLSEARSIYGDLVDAGLELLRQMK